MAYRVTHLVVVGGLALSLSVHAAAQGPPTGAAAAPVTGSGTPGTVPVWTSGKTLGNSLITSGTSVTIAAPLRVSGIVTMGPAGGSSALAGFGGVGLSGTGTSLGLSGTGTTTGVGGSGGTYGVLGIASDALAYGVLGTAEGANSVGVEGHSPNVGVRGHSSTCDSSGCTPATGVGGQFVAGAGGLILQGFLANFSGPGGWDEKFKVDSEGTLSIHGNAFKPGGGSWAVLSDRRAKTSIRPLSGALNQVLRLRGVSYEYTNPSAFHELSGRQIGMVAQDVEAVFPSWVDTGEDGYKRLTFRGFEALTVEALRELDEQVTSSTAEAATRIDELERQNTELRRAVEGLTQTVRTLQNK